MTSAREWRCFHCDDVFTDWGEARNHFGYTPEDGPPSCKTTRGEDSELYHLKRRLELYQREDTDLHRALHVKDAEMHAKVRQAEETGYSRGLADFEHLPAVQQLRGRARKLEEALGGIRQYANDTLSGRVGGPDDRSWQRAAVVEMRNRARAALEQPATESDAPQLFTGSDGAIDFGPLETGSDAT